MQYQFLAVAFCLMGVVVSRRHLCDNLTLPECTNGDKADYNPTGENRWEGGQQKYWNPITSSGTHLARMGLPRPARTDPTQL